MTPRRIPDDVASRGSDFGKGGRSAGGRGGGGGGGTLPPSGGSGSMGLGQIAVSPPTVERPPSAQDFNLAGTLIGRTTANTPAAFPSLEFAVPSANVAVIRSVSILANTLLLTSDIRWALLFDGVPAEGWDSLTILPRAAGSVERAWTPEETFIPVPEGARITMEVTVADGGTYQVSAGLHGWFYPTRIANNFRGAYG